MADSTVTAEIGELYQELDAVTLRIANNQTEHDELYVTRNELFARLLAAGERQAVIARRAGMTSTAVAFAVGKTYQRGE